MECSYSSHHMSKADLAPIPFYRQVLQQALADRIAENPRYSLRAFSRALGVPAGALSEVLAGKRLLSPKMAKKFFESLGFTADEQIEFLKSLAKAKIDSVPRRISPEMRDLLTTGAQNSPKVEELSGEVFRTIADWYHYAILELALQKGFSGAPSLIAAQLGISPTEARLAVERLTKLELLEKNEDGWNVLKPWTDTLDKTITSAAHQRRQRQILEKSRYSLDNDPISERNHSAVTFSVDPSRMKEAKSAIQDFMWDFTRRFSGGRKKRVYEISVQLFPLQKN